MTGDVLDPLSGGHVPHLPHRQRVTVKQMNTSRHVTQGGTKSDPFVIGLSGERSEDAPLAVTTAGQTQCVPRMTASTLAAFQALSSIKVTPAMSAGNKKLLT